MHLRFHDRSLIVSSSSANPPARGWTSRASVPRSTPPATANCFGSQQRNHRLQAVVPPPSAARPEPAQRQIHVVGHDQDIVQIEPVVVNQRTDRLAAQVHERARLRQHDLRVRPAFPRHVGVGRTGFEYQLSPPRDLVDHLEADVVTRAAVSRTRIAKPDDKLHDATDR